MPRASKVAGQAPAEVSQESAPEAPVSAPVADSAPVPEGSIRILGQASNGEPALKQADPRVQPVDELIPLMLKPSGDEGSFVPGFQRNPKYTDPALAPAEVKTASPLDPRQGVKIIGASPSMAQQKVNVLF